MPDDTKVLNNSSIMPTVSLLPICTALLTPQSPGVVFVQFVFLQMARQMAPARVKLDSSWAGLVSAMVGLLADVDSCVLDELLHIYKRRILLSFVFSSLNYQFARRVGIWSFKLFNLESFEQSIRKNCTCLRFKQESELEELRILDSGGCVFGY